MTTFYANQSVIGVNFQAAPSSSNDWTLGAVFQGSGDSAWMWVLAPTALTTGDCVGVAQDFTVSGMTNAIAASSNSQVIGWAQTVFAASTYGWIALRGLGINVRVTAGTAITPGLPLYTSDGAGILTGATNSASAFQIFGVTIGTTASGATATAVSSGIAAYPTLRRPA